MFKCLMVLLPAMFVLTCCSDDPEVPATDRYVYYINEGRALHRYSIGTGNDERIIQDNVVWITQVAENGIMLFSTQTGDGVRLWGRCEDGAIIPVPVPVAESALEEYIVSATPPVLSYKGHHAAFVVHKRPLHSTDSTEWSTHLCVFDCAAWRMTVADCSAYLNSTFEGTGFTPDVLRVYAVHITDYGDASALIVHAEDRLPGGALERRSAVLGYDPGGFRMLDSVDAESGSGLMHHKFDPKTGTLYAFPSWKTPFAVDCRTGDVRDLVTPYVPFDPWTPVAYQTSEFVAGLYPQLALRRIDTGNETIVLTDVQITMHSYPDLVIAGGHTPTMSPDGTWIGMLWPTTNGEQSLFVLKRDGTDMKRISTGKLIAPVAISNEVPM